MSKPFNKLRCIVCLLFALVAGPMTRTQFSDLQAHGTEDVFWVAQVVSTSDGKQRKEATIVRARDIGGGQALGRSDAAE